MNVLLYLQLKDIQDNPYQPRITDDAEHIEKLARSIAADGLLQRPMGRYIGPNGTYQLAFGHSRRKAFEWLKQNWKVEGLTDRYDAYRTMPVEVTELSDQDMYRYAVTENVQRKDLAPTELAQALQRYMDEFGANSKQAGELFGMSDATVRGTVRLLDLTDDGKAALDSGKISQGTARTMLSVQKLARESVVDEIIKKIEQKGSSILPEDIIEHEIERLDNVVEMWPSHRDGKPRGGYDAWLLDMKNFPNKLLPQLQTEDAERVLGVQNNAKISAGIGSWLINGKDANHGLSVEMVEKLEHLVNTPACSACPFYSKINGSHYCGVKLCHSRKTSAWAVQKIEAASKNLRIAIYSGEGPYVLLQSYENKHEMLFAKRDKDLRLVPKSRVKGYHYQSFKGVDDDFVLVAAVGDAIDKLGSFRGRVGGQKTEKEKAEMRALKIYRARRLELMWEYTEVAQGMFETVPLSLLERLNDWKYIAQDDRIPKEMVPENEDTNKDFQRRTLVWRLIAEESSHYQRESLADQLVSFQELTKVRIPKGLSKRAAEWDQEIEAAAQPVSTETKVKK